MNMQGRMCVNTSESVYSLSPISLWKDNVEMTMNQMDIVVLVSHHTFLGQQMAVTAVLVWLGHAGQGLAISSAVLSIFPVFDPTSKWAF